MVIPKSCNRVQIKFFNASRWHAPIHGRPDINKGLSVMKVLKFFISLVVSLFLLGLTFCVFQLTCNTSNVLGRTIIALFYFIVASFAFYYLNKKWIKVLKPVFTTFILSPLTLGLLITLIGNLSIWFGFGGGSDEFTGDTYPPGSHPHESNWTHILTVNIQSRHAFWENKALKHLYIFVYNKSNDKMYEESHRVILNNLERKVKWDSFDNIELHIFNVPVSFSGNKAIYGDTTKVLQLNLKYNGKTNSFEKISEIINQKVVKE
jgi:hypothetical protein